MLKLIIGENLLKKILPYLISFIFLFIINSTVFAEEKSILLDDVNTKNFTLKVTNIPLSNIKELCSYNYCDYVDNDDFKTNLSNFTKKYIANISDVEIQKSILVKGIKITKIILYD